MKNFAVWCLVLLFANNICFAQQFLREGKLTEKAANALLVNNDAQAITKYFSAKGFKTGKIVQEGTTSFTGRDSLGNFTINIATKKLVSGARTIELTTLAVSRGKKQEIRVLAQDDENTYSIVKNKVKTTPVVNSQNERSSGTDAITACFQAFGRGAISSCSSCINCVKGCVRGRDKWYVKAICTVRCLPPCVGCIWNVTGFVLCVFSAS